MQTTEDKIFLATLAICLMIEPLKQTLCNIVSTILVICLINNFLNPDCKEFDKLGKLKIKISRGFIIKIIITKRLGVNVSCTKPKVSEVNNSDNDNGQDNEDNTQSSDTSSLACEESNSDGTGKLHDAETDSNEDNEEYIKDDYERDNYIDKNNTSDSSNDNDNEDDDISSIDFRENSNENNDMEDNDDMDHNLKENDNYQNLNDYNIDTDEFEYDENDDDDDNFVNSV